MYHVKKIFLNFLLFLQKILAGFAKKQKVENTFSSANKKSAINQAASLEISQKTNQLKEKTEKIAEKIVKKHLGDTDKTIEFLQKQNVRVFRTKFANGILKNISEKQGFITPLKGFKAFYLNFLLALICDKKLVFKSNSDALFVFNSKPVDKFFLAAQIYKYAAFKENMPGFEYDVQEKFKKIYYSPSMNLINSLTAGEIFALKEAIARDVESVDFAAKIQQETTMN